MHWSRSTIHLYPGSCNGFNVFNICLYSLFIGLYVLRNPLPAATHSSFRRRGAMSLSQTRASSRSSWHPALSPGLNSERCGDRERQRGKERGREREWERDREREKKGGRKGGRKERVEKQLNNNHLKSWHGVCGSQVHILKIKHLAGSWKSM